MLDLEKTKIVLDEKEVNRLVMGRDGVNKFETLEEFLSYESDIAYDIAKMAGMYLEQLPYDTSKMLIDYGSYTTDSINGKLKFSMVIYADGEKREAWDLCGYDADYLK